MFLLSPDRHPPKEDVSAQRSHDQGQRNHRVFPATVLQVNFALYRNIQGSFSKKSLIYHTG